jgi:hypothetical protein
MGPWISTLRCNEYRDEIELEMRGEMEAKDGGWVSPKGRRRLSTRGDIDRIMRVIIPFK